MHRVTILTKPDCPLCDQAKSMINKLVASHTDILVEEINILKNPDLHDQYKNDIPVILVDDVVRFKHSVDPNALAKLFYDEFGQKLIGF